MGDILLQPGYRLAGILGENNNGECRISAEGPAGGKFGTNWCEFGLIQLFD